MKNDSFETGEKKNRDDNGFCPYCMSRVEPGEVCPFCGLTRGAYQPAPHHLPPGTILSGRYLLGRVLGEGGFGITYIGCDLRLEMKVAVKEYFPADRVSRNAGQSLSVARSVTAETIEYEKGLKKFLQEARTLARMEKQPQIVMVRDYFEANGTAYIVMEYVDGMTFVELLKQRGGRISPRELFTLIEPLFGALGAVHKSGVLHRDISPDNLMLEDGAVRLLDFGCAREVAVGSETMTIALKQGYGPIEQYQGRGQGPWTDVYALAATIYYCLTGKKPPQALDRTLEDTLIPPRDLGVDITRTQQNAFLKGMAVNPAKRYRSMEEFYGGLYTAAEEKMDQMFAVAREKTEKETESQLSGTENADENKDRAEDTDYAARTEAAGSADYSDLTESAADSVQKTEMADSASEVVSADSAEEMEETDSATDSAVKAGKEGASADTSEDGDNQPETETEKAAKKKKYILLGVLCAVLAAVLIPTAWILTHRDGAADTAGTAKTGITTDSEETDKATDTDKSTDTEEETAGTADSESSEETVLNDNAVTSESELREALEDASVSTIYIESDLVANDSLTIDNKELIIANSTSLKVYGEMTVTGSEGALWLQNGSVDLQGSDLMVTDQAELTLSNAKDSISCGILTVMNSAKMLVEDSVASANLDAEGIFVSDDGYLENQAGLFLTGCQILVSKAQWYNSGKIDLDDCEVYIDPYGLFETEEVLVDFDENTSVTISGDGEMELSDHRMNIAGTVTVDGTLRLREVNLNLTGNMAVSGYGTLRYSGEIILSGELENNGNLYAVDGGVITENGGTFTGSEAAESSDWD